MGERFAADRFKFTGESASLENPWLKYSSRDQRSHWAPESAIAIMVTDLSEQSLWSGLPCLCSWYIEMGTRGCSRRRFLRHSPLLNTGALEQLSGGSYSVNATCSLVHLPTPQEKVPALIIYPHIDFRAFDWGVAWGHGRGCCHCWCDGMCVCPVLSQQLHFVLSRQVIGFVWAWLCSARYYYHLSNVQVDSVMKKNSL